MPELGRQLGEINPDPWDVMSGLISPEHLNQFPDSSKSSEPEEMIHLSR